MYHLRIESSLVAQMIKNPPALRETWVRFLGWEDPLEKEMATHSSILAWRILILAWRIQYSCLENSRRLQSMGVTRVGHNLATKPPPPYIYSDFSQTPVFSLENLVILVFTKLKRHYHQWHIVTNQVHCWHISVSKGWNFNSIRKVPFW